MQTTDQKLPIFSQTINPELLAQAVRVYQSNQRQATAKTKTRSEINRTKKKWFKQKGTGNARHGARTPNIFVGGGVAHGPTGLQNYRLKLTQKMKKQAMLTALAMQAPNFFTNEDLINLDGKTKNAVTLLSDKLTPKKRLLIVTDKITPNMYRSINNLPTALLVSARYLNLLHLIHADTIIINQAALTALETRLLSKEE